MTKPTQITELDKQIFKTIIQFKKDFKLTYSEETLIDKVIENITENKHPTYGLRGLTVTEELVIRKVMDYLNRRIKVEVSQ